MKLAGKTAVVTGGNSGIGLATAKQLIQEGANVVIVGRNQETLDAEVAALGDKATAIRADVSKIGDLENLFSEVKGKYNGIDVLVVNAGIAPVRPLDVIDEEYFNRVFDVNVKGAFFTVQKALPVLNDGGSIVMVTSTVNVKGFPNFGVYAASKAAVRSLVRSFSAELLERNIRVNAISPGPIETPIFGKMELPDEAIKEFGTTIQNAIPLKRMGTSEEVAKSITFLASDDSSYILGTELAVDGGFSQL